MPQPLSFDPRRRRRARSPRTLRMAPGTIVADPGQPKPVLRLIAYDADRFVEQEITDVAALDAYLHHWKVTWLDVAGLGDADVIKALGARFKLHPLALEDVLDTEQRPKLEGYQDHLYIVLRMAEVGEYIHTEQVSIFVGQDFVLTFQEIPGDCLEPVRQRLRSHRSRIRDDGADYLAYALIDGIIDGYFPVLEVLGERLEHFENEIIERPEVTDVGDIHDMRRDILHIRRSIWPVRDLLSAMEHEESIIDRETRIYIRDGHDHVVRLMDLLENYRDLSSGLLEIYLTAVSNRMNEVMKVLTIISTIFIPLSFIASVYGMNFRWMPELQTRWGYFVVLGVMAVAAVGFLLYFRQRGWIGRARRRRARGRGAGS